METLDPQGGANLDASSLIGRIYVGDHKTLLHTKYISYGLMVSEKILKVVFFSIIQSMETLDPLGWASLDPRGLISRIYVQIRGRFLKFFPL